METPPVLAPKKVGRGKILLINILSIVTTIVAGLLSYVALTLMAGALSGFEDAINIFLRIVAVAVLGIALVSFALGSFRLSLIGFAAPFILLATPIVLSIVAGFL